MLDRVTDAVLLNGTVGAGKSTTGAALSDLLWAAGTPHALLDLDDVRMLRPPPAGDPFQFDVATRNLGDVARNFRAAGAGRMVVAGVIETREQLQRVRDALQPWSVLAVRLTVTEDDAVTRLRTRHADAPDDLAWHLDRSPRLAAILERAAIDDVVIDTTGRSAPETAALVARAAGW